jgi:hypothetical protein
MNMETTRQEEEEHQSSIRYTISQICEQIGQSSNVTFDKYYVAALTQIVYDWILYVLAPDLVQTAQFRTNAINSSNGRKIKSLVIQPEDVLFQSRRHNVVNRKLAELLKEMFKAQKLEEQQKGLAQPKKRERIEFSSSEEESDVPKELRPTKSTGHDRQNKEKSSLKLKTKAAVLVDDDHDSEGFYSDDIL